MKELELDFIGTGEVKGFRFTQIKQNQKAFIYKVEHDSITHYEVFLRRENKQFNCISYPKTKSFGQWAWTCKTLDRAQELFAQLSIDNDEQAKTI